MYQMQYVLKGIHLSHANLSQEWERRGSRESIDNEDFK